MNEDVKTTNPTLLVGLQSEMPVAPVPPRTIYFCVDTGKYFRFENNVWTEILKPSN